MAKRIPSLGEYFEQVLEACANASPNRLTTPESVRFFLHDGNRYYPIYNIEYDTYSLPSGGERFIGRIVINRHVYCLDPSSADSPFSGHQFLHNREKADSVLKWICSAFGEDFCYYLDIDLTFAKNNVIVIDW